MRNRKVGNVHKNLTLKFRVFLQKRISLTDKLQQRTHTKVHNEKFVKSCHKAIWLSFGCSHRRIFYCVHVLLLKRIWKNIIYIFAFIYTLYMYYANTDIKTYIFIFNTYSLQRTSAKFNLLDVETLFYPITYTPILDLIWLDRNLVRWAPFPHNIKSAAH